jgi:hypothetical protein
MSVTLFFGMSCMINWRGLLIQEPCFQFFQSFQLPHFLENKQFAFHSKLTGAHYHDIQQENDYMNQLILLLLALTISACSARSNDLEPGNSNQTDSDLAELIECHEPRPVICTQIYQPVCATLKSGGSKTFASDCTACSNQDVIAYQKEACE